MTYRQAAEHGWQVRKGDKGTHIEFWEVQGGSDRTRNDGRIGRIPEGILQIRAALRAKPDFAPAHFALGTALLQSGRAAEAIAEYEAVLRLRPDDPSARKMLDRARLQAGDAVP